MSEKGKAKYVTKAEEDKEKQDKLIAEYVAEHAGDVDEDDIGSTSEVASKPKKMRKKKDPDAPKNPKNAYLFFSNEKRQAVKDANPDASFGEVVSSGSIPFYCSVPCTDEMLTYLLQLVCRATFLERHTKL